MQTRLIRAEEKGAIDEALEVLRGGGLLAFPTETVYGLGARLFDPRALERLFSVKGRPRGRPFILHLAEKSMVFEVAASVPEVATRLMEAFWPGPLTLVLPARPEVPMAVRGGGETVGVRIPAHPVALELIGSLGEPLPAPSANLTGRPSPTTADHVLRDLGGKIELVLDAGPTGIGVESTVLDLSGGRPRILRAGAVAWEDLRPFLPDLEPGGEEGPSFTFRKEVLVFSGQGKELVESVAREYDAAKARGRRPLILALGEHAGEYGEREKVVWASFDRLHEAARNLFALLRELEEGEWDLFLFEPVEEKGLGRAVMSRLRRAARGAR